MNVFGERLRELRRRAGLSQHALAAASGLSRTSIARWELGWRYPAWDDVERLARALGVCAGDFDGKSRK
jgi:transcriptional regulator with XRE-family HTH domain